MFHGFEDIHIEDIHTFQTRSSVSRLALKHLTFIYFNRLRLARMYIAFSNPSVYLKKASSIILNHVAS